jgi:two-component system phosphate regulon sensor histidine kinase PhoR
MQFPAILVCVMVWFLAVVGLGAATVFAALWAREKRRLTDRDRWFLRALDSLGISSDAGTAMTPLAELNETSHETQILARAWRETAVRLRDEAGEQRRAQRDLEDVLASLQDAVLVVDGEARLRFLNAAALAMFAVRIEDVLGAQMLEALPSFGLESAVRAALHEGENTANEVALYGTKVREVLLRVSPVRRADGTVSGAVAIVQDLTELRRLERVRRDFVANASHELRTPIANIRATAETIIDNPEDPKLAARFLPHLVSEAERLSRLVSDLLDLARRCGRR